VTLRSVTATDYYSFCAEIGCDTFDRTWDELRQLEGAMSEPMGLWLPPMMVRSGTSTYVIGVEVSANFQSPIPDRTEVINMSSTTYLLFHSSPSESMIEAVRAQIAEFEPASRGLSWDKDLAPVFQLAPDDVRGYTEGHPVKR
jgi:hypothetical protein